MPSARFHFHNSSYAFATGLGKLNTSLLSKNLQLHVGFVGS
jgi:hypothetical protein